VAAGLATPTATNAQPVEAAGSRAAGMGGAFVAVANDSTATWWNPAGLAAGPFLDLAIAHNRAEIDERLPAASRALTSITLATPPFGVSYYRFQITDIRTVDSTGQERAGREEGRTGLGVRSLSVTQFGATILHTLVTGVHVGTTVKYVRATPRTSTLESTDAALVDLSTRLEAGDDLDGGDSQGTADLDVGVLAVTGPFRFGAVVRNVREPQFDSSSGSAESNGAMALPRQVRIGAAFDGEAVGMRRLMVALDADLRRYDAGDGERRVIALGAEQWLFARRLGLRGGARFNTVGARDEAVTGGASFAARPGVYVDGHLVYGGGAGEQGWGVAARVSF
jgi:hypothetical protein